jgi:hypothetical protein
MLIDLHLHSENSYDSTASVKEMMDEVKSRGYSAVAFAEHVTKDLFAPIKAYEQAVKYGNGIFVYPAAEFSIKEPTVWKARSIHCVVYSDISTLEELCRRNPKSFEELAGFMVFAHPTKKDLSKHNPMISKFDGVEYTENMPALRGDSQYYSDDDIDVVIAGSDAHSPHDIGCCTDVRELFEHPCDTLKKENIMGLRFPHSPRNFMEGFDPLRI